MDQNQLLKIGITLAELVHYSIAWDESLNGDDVDIISKKFEQELKELNGE
jgi:hypothetical protein